MRKVNKTLRTMGYVAPAALAFVLAAPLVMGYQPTDENLWSAKKEGTAWTTRYGECWQSKTGPGDLAPCVVEKKPEPPKLVELNFNLDQYVVPGGVANMGQVDEIDEYIDQLKSTPDRERITIVGHTSADGSDDYNMKLGQRRADAVRDYFIRRGYPEEYLAPAKSRGEYELRPGYDPYSVAQRRVEFHKTRL